MAVLVVFKACVEAMRKGALIERVSEMRVGDTQPADMETDDAA